MVATAETRGTPERLLSVREAAERLGVSRQHVYRLVQRGELPGLHVGGVVRIDPRELEEWLYGPPEAA